MPVESEDDRGGFARDANQNRARIDSTRNRVGLLDGLCQIEFGEGSGTKLGIEMPPG